MFYFFGNVAVNKKGQYCQRHGKKTAGKTNSRMLVKKPAAMIKAISCLVCETAIVAEYKMAQKVNKKLT